MSKYTPAQNKANQRYQKKTYDQIAIRLPKGYRDTMKDHAAKKGYSLASYILQLFIDDGMEIETKNE